MFDVHGPPREDVVGDDAAERVGDDAHLAIVGQEIRVALHKHLVETVQLLLKGVPDLHPEKGKAGSYSTFSALYASTNYSHTTTPILADIRLAKKFYCDAKFVKCE